MWWNGMYLNYIWIISNFFFAWSVFLLVYFYLHSYFHILNNQFLGIYNRNIMHCTLVNIFCDYLIVVRLFLGSAHRIIPGEAQETIWGARKRETKLSVSWADTQPAYLLSLWPAIQHLIQSTNYIALWKKCFLFKM